MVTWIIDDENLQDVPDDRAPDQLSFARYKFWNSDIVQKEVTITNKAGNFGGVQLCTGERILEVTIHIYPKDALARSQVESEYRKMFNDPLIAVAHWIAEPDRVDYLEIIGRFEIW